MKNHPAADIFPMMSDAELKKLKADIEENGLQVPIESCKGKILDGRNRYKACQELGIEPDVMEIDPLSPVAYVLSLNLHRRHLNASQRAAVAAKTKPLFEAEAKKRQRNSQGQGVKGPANLPDLNGDARDKAGEALNVSGRSVQDGTTVIENGTASLLKAVEDGEVAVSLAAKFAKAVPKREQNKVIKEAVKAKSSVKDAIRAATPKPEPKPKKTFPAPDAEFDRSARGVKLREWLRAELDKWPEKHRPFAAHQIRQILDKEFNV